MAAAISCHKFNVPEPTYCRLSQIHLKDKDQLKSLVSLLSDLIPSQVQHNKLLSEFKLLNLVLYKRGGQLRKAKCFQLLKRVQACLKRLGKFEKLYQLLIALNNDLKSADVSDRSGRKMFYLPSQQSWIFVLYLQTEYVQLLEATATYCIAAFEHLSQHLAIGWLIHTMIVFMGIVARIWMLCETLIEKVVTNYNKLHPYKDLFEPSESDWSKINLPELLCHDKATYLNLTEKFTVDSHEFTKSECSEMNQVNIEDLGVPVTFKRKLEDNFQPNKRFKMDDDNNNDYLTETVKDSATVICEISSPICDKKIKIDKLKKYRKKQKLKKNDNISLTDNLDSLPLKNKKKNKIKKQKLKNDNISLTEDFDSLPLKNKKKNKIKKQKLKNDISLTEDLDSLPLKDKKKNKIKKQKLKNDNISLTDNLDSLPLKNKKKNKIKKQKLKNDNISLTEDLDSLPLKNKKKNKIKKQKLKNDISLTEDLDSLPLKDKKKNKIKKQKLKNDNISLTEDLDSLPLKNRKKKKIPLTKSEDDNLNNVEMIGQKSIDKTNTINSESGKVRRKMNKMHVMEAELAIDAELKSLKKTSNKADLKEGTESNKNKLKKKVKVCKDKKVAMNLKVSDNVKKLKLERKQKKKNFKTQKYDNVQ